MNAVPPLPISGIANVAKADRSNPTPEIPMALLRVRTPSRPGDKSKDVDLGEATGRKQPYDVMARTIDNLPRGLFRHLVK